MSYEKENQKNQLRALVNSAMLVALAFVLSYFKFSPVPYGGSVTALSMLPILIIGLRYGSFWGIGSGIVYGGLQMLQEFYAPPVQAAWAFFVVVAFDFLIAFGVLGLSGFFPKTKPGILAGVTVTIGLRYVCHVFSGITIWASYAWEGWPGWLYSLAYNGTYMVPELILTLCAVYWLMKKDILQRFLV